MRRILWLPSWYPNQTDELTGDFIQRQARAASLFHSIHVIHVVQPDAGANPSKTTFQQSIKENLTEQIVYKQRSNKWVIGKILNFINYFRLNLKYLNLYIKENGLPHYVHVHVPVKAGLIALYIKFRYGIPYLLTEHYAIYNHSVSDRFEQRSFLFRFLTRLIVRHSSSFLPVSKELGETVNSMVTKKAFEVVANVVDTEHFNYVSPPNGIFRFIHISSMVRAKNVEGIIDAAKKVWAKTPRFELTIVGPISEQVYAYAQKSGLLNTCIFFTGTLTYVQVAEQLKNAHVLVLFSASENLPCVILEALCCGRPVISSNVGGIPEVIEKENGLLVNHDDVTGLANAMEFMLQNFQQYSTVSIAKAASSLYNYTAIGAHLAEIYQKNH